MDRCRHSLSQRLLAMACGAIAFFALTAGLPGPVHAAEVLELSHQFRNGDDYDSASDTADGPLLKLSMNRQQASSNGLLLRFGKLGEHIRGDQVEILDARLELHYADETWTFIKYDLAVAASLDGSARHRSAGIDGKVTIAGDKWPPGVKTPLRSWVSIPLRPETVQRWVDDEKTNQGMVLWIASARVGEDQVPVDLRLHEGQVGGPFVALRSNQGPASERPRLVVRYRLRGNAPPAAPRLPVVPAGTRLASPAAVAWEPAADPNPGDRVLYQFQAGYRQGGGLTWAGPVLESAEPRLQWPIEEDRERYYGSAASPPPGQSLWYRVRARDDKGATSAWREAGPFEVTADRWSVWMMDGNRKAWRDSPVPATPARSIRIKAARNEWEPFQIVVASHAGLKQLTLVPSPLKNTDGATLPAPTLFRQHYVPIEETANATWGKLGPVPDALVPTVHPVTGHPTGGRYGGNRFDVGPGSREAFWLEVFVPSDTAPGIYRGTVTVSADGVEPQRLQVELEVWDFELPSPRQLVACFQLDERSVQMSHQIKGGGTSRKAVSSLTHQYEEMLHEHHISNWSPITGFNYGLNGAKVSVENDVVTVDWSGFDAIVGPYMDGSAFKDGVPAQCLFAPYWLPTPKNKGEGWAERVNQHNYKNIRYDLFAQFIRQLEQHLRSRGWLDRSYVFYFDEPFISNWKYEAFINTAKVIRKEAPGLRILLSDGYRGKDGYKDKAYITEPIEKYVDVWDPVTFQVSSPELVEYYRSRKKAGHFDMWCQTLANANPNRAIINLFPEYDMPFHRMWGVMSWSMGFQAIEWWQTIIWWDERQRQRIDPWIDPTAFPGFRQPLNGDGRLFFPGTEADIGGPDIPISTLRMKALREAIEDYEYLHLLEQAGSASRFDLDALHTLDASRAAKMRSPMPMGKGPWQWWEGDPDQFMSSRQQIARLILDARGRPR